MTKHRNVIAESFKHTLNVYDELSPAKRKEFEKILNIHDNKDFQQHVNLWMLDCFGDNITRNKEERNFRFLEESLELVQACGFTKENVHTAVDYVFSRKKGEVAQEVGGVMVCLAALCEAHHIKMDKAGRTELHRAIENTKKIRAKHENKPTNMKGKYNGETCSD